MHKEIINGIMIRTNLGEPSVDTLVSGECKDGFDIVTNTKRLSDKEFVESLVDNGYIHIRLCNVTTRIRGFYEKIAYCKEIKEGDF